MAHAPVLDVDFCYELLIVLNFLGLNVRLAGAPVEYAGRVEVFYAGVWGTVARNGHGWNRNADHVVCRQLGYAGAISSGYGSQFGDGTGPVWFVNPVCRGTESNFGKCLLYDVYGYPEDISPYQTATVLCNQKGKK